MAKKDVVLYFLQMEDQYLEMLDNLKEFKEMAASGAIAAEEYEQAAEEVDVLKQNYERIAYIMFLLNKPNRKSKSPTRDELSWYNALKGASKEAILDENRDALATLKKVLKEYKNEGK